MRTCRERALMVMTAVVLAALGIYILIERTRLPYSQWSSAASLACGLAALWPLICWATARAYRDGAFTISEIPRRHREVYLGRGRAWTPRRARTLRDCAMAGRPAPNPEPQDLFVPETDLDKHMLVLGTTGSGKSRLMELLAVQAIRRGDATAIIDPKGDERLLARVEDECRRTGRKLALIAPPYPESSMPYNPIGRFIEPREAADRVAALLPAGGEAEPFRAFAWEVAHATVSAMVCAGEPVTLSGLRYWALDDPDDLLKRAVQAKAPDLLRGRDVRKAATLAARHEPAVAAFLALASRPVEHTQKMTAALVPALSKLTSGSNRGLLSPVEGGFAWESLDVAYFFLGSLLGADSAQAVARMALLDFQSHVGRIYAYGRAGPPISLFVDELADVASPALVNTLNKARGAGVRLALAAQTLADLEASLGSDARARQVIANVNTVVQFRAQSTTDAEAFADLAGRRLLPSATEGEAYEPALFTSGFKDVEDFRAVFSRQRSWRDEPLVPPWAVMDLAPFQFFARWGSRVVRGTTPMLPPPPSAAVEAL